MHYEFPRIEHIEEVRSVIADADGFATINGAGHTIFCYSYISPEVFPDISDRGTIIRRECRGIAFGSDGTVISRPFHKFFNIGERVEVQGDQVSLSKPHVVLEKLDGSMVRPIPINGGYRLATKKGVTDVAAQPEAFLARNSAYHEFIQEMISIGRTPIFEWCSNKQRIVLDYPEDRLVLLAVRENVSGEYIPFETVKQDLRSDPRLNSIEVVEEHESTSSTVEELVSRVRETDHSEGWVLRFDDGHMVKVKSDWYATRHKALASLEQEKNVVALLVAEGADDLKPLLSPRPKAALEAFEANFWSGIETVSSGITETYNEMRAKYGDDRKAFATGDGKSLPGPIRSVVFAMWDGRDPKERLIEQIGKSCGSGTRVEQARWAWNDHAWNYQPSHDE